MGADAARPMTIGGTHPPSLGVGIVGPVPTHVAYPSSVPIGSGVDVALRTSGPTLADVRSDIPRPRPAHASPQTPVPDWESDKVATLAIGLDWIGVQFNAPLDTV